MSTSVEEIKITYEKVDENTKSNFISLCGIDQKFLSYVNRKDITVSDIHHLLVIETTEIDSAILMESLAVIGSSEENNNIEISEVQKQLWLQILSINRDNYVPLLIHFDEKVDEIMMAKILGAMEDDEVLAIAQCM